MQIRQNVSIQNGPKRNQSNAGTVKRRRNTDSGYQAPSGRGVWCYPYAGPLGDSQTMSSFTRKANMSLVLQAIAHVNKQHAAYLRECRAIMKVRGLTLPQKKERMGLVPPPD